MSQMESNYQHIKPSMLNNRVSPKDAQLYCDCFQWQHKLHKTQEMKCLQRMRNFKEGQTKISTHNLTENEMLEKKPPRVQL
jgi:hypothetical protein